MAVDLCEVCNCRDAVGVFPVEDVETPLCEHCSVYRDTDGNVVIDYGF